MTRWLVVIAWLSGTLFPYTWLRNESTRFRRLVDTFFASEWTHVVGHLLLYSMLAFLLWWALRRAPGLLESAATLALALPVGVAQETLQTLFRHRAFGAPEIFDLLVDLTGVVMGLLAARMARKG